MSQAFKLLSHAIWQVFGNFTSAFKITALPFLLFCAPIFPLRTALKYSFEKHRKSSDADPFSSVLLIKQQAQQFAEQTSFYLWLSIPGILVTIAVAFWVIVSWHRFILLEDSTHFLLPKFHGRQILSYMWRVILIVLLFIPFYLAYFALALIFFLMFHNLTLRRSVFWLLQAPASITFCFIACPLSCRPQPSATNCLLARLSRQQKVQHLVLWFWDFLWRY